MCSEFFCVKSFVEIAFVNSVIQAIANSLANAEAKVPGSPQLNSQVIKSCPSLSLSMSHSQTLILSLSHFLEHA